MIPSSHPVGSPEVPRQAAFWMPRRDELDDDGIGDFQNTWLIRNVSVADARDVIDEERRLVDAIDQLAKDAEDFERLAGIAEFGGIDDPAYELSDLEHRVLSEFVSDLPADLGGLELGVAGLAHALATVRILPAASCRSHPKQSWSPTPVVLFATTEFRARALEPLVQAAGCVFAIDEHRRELLAVHGASVFNTMALASAILANRSEFVQRRPRRSPKPSRPGWQQPTLF